MILSCHAITCVHFYQDHQNINALQQISFVMVLSSFIFIKPLTFRLISVNFHWPHCTYRLLYSRRCNSPLAHLCFSSHYIHICGSHGPTLIVYKVYKRILYHSLIRDLKINDVWCKSKIIFLKMFTRSRQFEFSNVRLCFLQIITCIQILLMVMDDALNECQPSTWRCQCPHSNEVNPGYRQSVPGVTYNPFRLIAYVLPNHQAPCWRIAKL
jgi:hypothetical protein